MGSVPSWATWSKRATVRGKGEGKVLGQGKEEGGGRTGPAGLNLGG